MSFQNSRPAERALLSITFSSIVCASAWAQGGTTGVTERVTSMGDGSLVSQDCSDPVVSADGRYVAFSTYEPLLPEDDNDYADVYVRDRETGSLVCASVDHLGRYVDGSSVLPGLSADGRCVVFQTRATVFGFDYNATEDIIFVDLDVGLPRLVSGVNGNFLAGNGRSTNACISADGRSVAFRSRASNLLPGDSNGTWDIYVNDLSTNTLHRASVGAFGEADGPSYTPSLSGNGMSVAFHSTATNLVAGDSNESADVFVRHLDLGTTELLSRNFEGDPGNASSFHAVISDWGNVVAFRSNATDLVYSDTNESTDTFYAVVGLPEVHLVSASTTGVPSSGWSSIHDLSPDGRYVAFGSNGDDLVPGSAPGLGSDFDIYLRDLELSKTWLVSRPSGAEGTSNGHSESVSLSEGGAAVAFSSDATNLAPGPQNSVYDVFLRTPFMDPRRYCDTMVTVDGCVPSISATGVSSASKDHGFRIVATDLAPDKPSLLFYGFQGPKHLPFMGGVHCVKGATKRSRILRSIAFGAGPCSGILSFDMNAFAAGSLPGNPQPGLSLVGQKVNVQFWGRDPGSAHGVFLTDAIEYLVGP